LKVLKFFILTLGLLLSNQLLAQKESAYWYFGERAGLNFNTEPPTPLTNGQLNSREGCAAISDTNGSLLFYTDGISVWDRNHTEMPNGYALLGDKSSTQSAIIIPNPVRRGLYYIFTVDEPGKLQADAGDTIEGINYSEVDMTLNGGYGDVITGKKTNMVKKGIVDPVLVTKSALKNAVSVVTTIISADCVISNMRGDESN